MPVCPYCDTCISDWEIDSEMEGSSGIMKCPYCEKYLEVEAEKTLIYRLYLREE